jgi:hypothetical protein
MNDEHVSRALERVREKATGLPRARAEGLACIVEGDEGGQVYFTTPAWLISCAPDRLVQLAFEVDWINWRDPVGVHVSFDAIDSDVVFGGGMGGGLVTGATWIHDTMRGSMLGDRVEEALHSKRTSLWPSGSTAIGEPRDALDLVSLLEQETGDAPVFELVRKAAKLREKKIETEYARRLSVVLKRLITANEARNRIQAAELLGDEIDSSSLVDAVYAAAAGAIVFPMWGMWQRRAVYVLGKAARAKERSACDALAALSAQDSWIAEFGAYAFAWPRWSKTNEKYFDPDTFRSELSDLFGSGS